MDHGDGFAPVALAGEDPIAQAVVDRAPAQALLLQVAGDLLLGLRRRKAVDELGVDGCPVSEESLLVEQFRQEVAARPGQGFDHRADRQVELLGEFKIALVVRRDRHDGPGPVAGQHVVRDPNRDALAVDRVDRVRAGRDPGLFLLQVRALKLALALGGLDVGFDLALHVRDSDLAHQRMLGGEDHVGRPVKGVRASGEDGDRVLADGEMDFGPL